LVNLQHITTQDFSLTNVPGGLLEAIMSDSGTRVLQRPQIRAVDNFKAVLKIGEKIPTASGSYSPGVGSVGVNALVNTQFTYIDTGVNLEMTPRVHDNGEVSMHIDIDISQVDSYNDLGGISQPVIGQHKITLDVRMKDGQINMIGGLVQLSDSKTVSGVPGLANIPILNRLFTSDQTTISKDELLISITPHIVRGPDITAENVSPAYAGNATNYAVRYAHPAALAAPAIDGAGTTPASAPPVTMPAAPGMPGSAAPVIAPSVAGPAARVSFAPTRLDAQMGSSFTADIRADGAANLQSFESQIKFDPKILKVNSITAGDLLQQNGVQLVPQRNILNDSGDASATLVREAAKGAVNGSGTLLTITFQAVGKGQTTVVMPKTLLRDSAGGSTNVGGSPLTVTVK
jgi:general secretion pathway protein D